MIKKFSELLASRIRVEVLFKDKYENCRENPFHSERIGIEESLKLMGIPYDYKYDKDFNIIAVNVAGCVTEI